MDDVLEITAHGDNLYHQQKHSKLIITHAYKTAVWRSVLQDPRLAPVTPMWHDAWEF